MNIMMENIITGIVRPVGGPTGKGIKVDENIVRQNEGEKSARYEDGELPIGLGVVPIIPTGSIFIPRELVMPEEEKPLEVEVVVSDKQALIPQKVEEPTTKGQKSDKSDMEQKPQAIPTTVSNNHTIDILI